MRLLWYPAATELNGTMSQRCDNYYCHFHNSLVAAGMEIRGLSPDDVIARRVLPEADAIIVGHHCTRKPYYLHHCLNRLRVRALGGDLPDDRVPLIIVLNKMYEQPREKMMAVRANVTLMRTALTIVHTPLTDVVRILTTLPSAFVPLATRPSDGPYAHAGTDTMSYTYDFGFTGGWEFKSDRYAFRRELLNRASIASMRRDGLRVFLSASYLPQESYLRTLASSKLWLSTTERNLHVGPRFFEVMISGRALLLCDRNMNALDPLGIIEGVHVAMFNSTAEFRAKLQHYLDHEEERREMVRAARALVLERHLWRHRGLSTVQAIREAISVKVMGRGESKGTRRESASGKPLHVHSHVHARQRPDESHPPRENYTWKAGGCPTNPRSSIAVCLTGFVRTLGQAHVYNSLSKGFRSQASHVDFFGTVSSSGEDTAKGQHSRVTSESLATALDELRPARWEDDSQWPHHHSPPRCNLLCMRQFDRFARCSALIESREKECGMRYAWVVKARPDITINADHSLTDLGMRHESSVVYKDRRAGDLVLYVPRRHWDDVARAMTHTSCEEAKSFGVHCDAPTARTGGAGCKCNAFMSGIIAKRLALQLRYHKMGVQIVRTDEAAKLIARSKRLGGGDGMRLLHNKSRAEALQTVGVQPADYAAAGP